MAELTNVQHAFLAGVCHGRRLAHKQARRDAEDLTDGIHEAEVEARVRDVREGSAPYQSIVIFDPGESQD